MHGDRAEPGVHDIFDYRRHECQSGGVHGQWIWAVYRGCADSEQDHDLRGGESVDGDQYQLVGVAGECHYLSVAESDHGDGV